MATIVKTPSGTWKAVIRKAGWPTTVKTFRLKKDADDWSRRTEDARRSRLDSAAPSVKTAASDPTHDTPHAHPLRWRAEGALVLTSFWVRSQFSLLSTVPGQRPSIALDAGLRWDCLPAARAAATPPTMLATVADTLRR